MTALILSGLVLFFALAVYRREWGVYLTVLLLPAYQIRFSVGFLPLTFLESAVLLLGLVQIIDLTRRRAWREVLKSLTRSPASAAFAGLFLLAAFLSIFTGPSLVKAAGIFKAYFFEAVLFSALVILIIDTREKLSRLIQCIALLVAYLSVFGIYQFLTLHNLPTSWWAVNVASRRITSLLNHPNALALLLGPSLAFLVFVRKNRLVWAVLPLGAIAMYLSFSRAAWLALLVGVVIVGLFTEHRNRILLASAAAALLILSVPYSRQKLVELSFGADPSRENRLVLWSAAADILKKSPLFGAGLTGFREEYQSYPLGPDRVVQNYPHNFFLNFWLETGFFGMLAITALIFLFYKRLVTLWRHEEFKNLTLGMAAAMAMILLHGMVDVPYFKNDLAVAFWMLFALPYLKFLPS